MPLINESRDRLAWAGVQLTRIEAGLSSALEIVISHGFLFKNMTEAVLFLREPFEGEAQERSPLSLAPASSLPAFSLPEYYDVAIDVPSAWQPVPVMSKPYLQGKLYFKSGETVSYSTVRDATSETLLFYRQVYLILLVSPLCSHSTFHFQGPRSACTPGELDGGCPRFELDKWRGAIHCLRASRSIL